MPARGRAQQGQAAEEALQAARGRPSDGYHVTEEQMEHALDRYYVMAGWDKATGMPTEASLDRYGLDWAVSARAPNHYRTPADEPAGGVDRLQIDQRRECASANRRDRAHEDHFGAIVQGGGSISLLPIDERPGLFEDRGNAVVIADHLLSRSAMVACSGSSSRIDFRSSRSAMIPGI